MAFKGALENLALRRSLTPIFARKGESGQALIEFAFVFPLLFVFILLIVDFGFALDRREVIQHAVREGARAGAVGEDIHFITDEQSGGILNASNVNVCYENENGGSVGDAGDTVRVTGNYSYNLMIGGGAFLSGLIPPIVMKPSAGARLEKTASGVVVQC